MTNRRISPTKDHMIRCSFMIIKLIVLLLSLATVMGQYMDPAPVRLSPSIIDQSTDRHLVKVYVNDRISAYDSGNIIPTMSRIG